MSDIGHLLEQLRSESRDEAVDAAESLGRQHSAEAVPVLLEVLQETDDRVIRNAVAMALREIGDSRAAAPLAKLIDHDHTLGSRGTLLYALESFDCTPFAPMLIRLVTTGGFEVRAQALRILIDLLAPEKKVYRVVLNCEAELDEARNRLHHLELLFDAIGACQGP